MKTKFLVLIMSIFMISCIPQKDEGISGMGDNDKPLEVDIPFDQLPQLDSVLITDIVNGVSQDKINFTAVLESDTAYQILKGSGGSYYNGQYNRWVTVRIRLQNLSNRPIYVMFPAGLIFEVNNPEYQHGILLNGFYIWVLPHSYCTIYLSLYCINYGKHGSTEQLKYKILGTTASSRMKELINLTKDKDINIDNYILNNNLDEYYNMTDKIQHIIWNLTSFEYKISDEDREYLKLLPNKPEEN